MCSLFVARFVIRSFFAVYNRPIFEVTEVIGYVFGITANASVFGCHLRTEVFLGCGNVSIAVRVSYFIRFVKGSAGGTSVGVVRRLRVFFGYNFAGIGVPILVVTEVRMPFFVPSVAECRNNAVIVFVIAFFAFYACRARFCAGGVFGEREFAKFVTGTFAYVENVAIAYRAANARRIILCAGSAGCIGLFGRGISNVLIVSVLKSFCLAAFARMAVRAVFVGGPLAERVRARGYVDRNGAVVGSINNTACHVVRRLVSIVLRPDIVG